MKIYALLGTLALLILPFSYVSITVGDAASSTTFAGFLYYSSETDTAFGFGDSSQSGTFQLDWVQESGLYHDYFDPVFFLGILVFLVLLVNIGLSVIATKKQYNNIPGMIVLGAGIILLFIRFLALSEDDLSFYEQTERPFFGTFTYLEIPLAFFYGLIFGILELKENK